MQVHRCKRIAVLTKLPDRAELEESISGLKLEKHGAYVGREILVRNGMPFIPQVWDRKVWAPAYVGAGIYARTGVHWYAVHSASADAGGTHAA